MTRLAVAAALAAGLVQDSGLAPNVLPASATAQLAKSLSAARPHAKHVWRDTPPFNADGTVNGYVEIPRGDRRKWEFDIAKQQRVIDRVIQLRAGGFPVNYGFVPQTVSYDGDPFDILVLGPAITGGTLVRGVIVGLMRMEDEKGLDSKVVVSLLGPDGRPAFALTGQDRETIGRFFNTYKLGEPGKFSRVPGWGSAGEGRSYVATTNAFFTRCRTNVASPCRIAAR